MAAALPAAPRPGAATVSRECENGRSRWAGASRPVPSPAVVSVLWPGSPCLQFQPIVMVPSGREMVI